MKRSRLLPAVLLYAWVPAQTTKAVLPGWRDVDPRVTSGRVVRDGDRAAIKGAKVETKGFRIDGRVVEADENGAFEVAGGPRCLQSGATSNWGIDYLRVSAPGCGVALVDTCASAPWADPIRLRPGATLTGKFEGVGEGHWINVVAPTTDLSWPPQSGLTCVDESWRGYTDAEGQFKIPDLPSQVQLDVLFDPALVPAFPGIDIHLVLQPGEERVLDIAAKPVLGAEPCNLVSADSKATWVPVLPTAVDADGRERELAWFEFVEGGRLTRHRVGGGRWHVHQHRACNHLEMTPGRFTLVARDAVGWIGFGAVEIEGSDAVVQPRVQLAQGGLLRIDGSALQAGARIALSSSGVEFAVFTLLPAELRYEVVPTGTVHLRVTIDGHDLTTRDIDTPAKSEVDVKL